MKIAKSVNSLRKIQFKMIYKTVELLIPSSVCSYSIKCFAIFNVSHDVLNKPVTNNNRNSAGCVFIAH